MPMGWQLVKACGSGPDSARRRSEMPFDRSITEVISGPIVKSLRHAGDLLPKSSIPTTTSLIATRGCHNRCGFCYLATDGLTMPYQVRDVEQVVAEFRADGQPYAVFIDNNLGSPPEYLRRLCRALRPVEKIWSAAVSIDVTDDPSLVREMALAGCTGVFVGFESLADANLVAHKKTPDPPITHAAWRFFTTTEFRSTAASYWASITMTGTFSPELSPGSKKTASSAQLPHPDTLPRHAPFPANGRGESALAPGLVAVRHRARRFQTQAHDC